MRYTLYLSAVLGLFLVFCRASEQASITYLSDRNEAYPLLGEMYRPLVSPSQFDSVLALNPSWKARARYKDTVGLLIFDKIAAYEVQIQDSL